MTIKKCIQLTILYVNLILQILIRGEQQVPCAFFFGDSLFDNGNNNMFPTLAKANFAPYGIDYPNGTPTGRFCNGRTIPDFLTEFLGFDEPIPPFATAKDSEILKGVNYASAAGGIRDESGYLTGFRTSMNGQLLNHKITICRIAKLMSDPTTVDDYLKKCLYGVNMGSNDYLNNDLQPQYLYPTNRLYTPDQFAKALTKQYSQQLRTLYSYGARKVVVFGLGPIGCIPQQLASIPATNGSSCVNSVNNNAVQLFNNELKPLIDNLNSNLPGAKFIYINTTSISLLDPSSIGITVTNAPCCELTPITGLCDPHKPLCNNRNEYAFWDNFHPTEALNRFGAKRMYNATLPSDAYPVDIRHLVQQ